MRRSKLTRMNVPDRVPSRCGSALKSAASTTVNSGDEVRVRPLRRDEQVAREKVVPSQLGVDADRQAIAFVGTDVAVERVDFAFGEVRRDAIPQRVEAMRRSIA